MDQQAEVKAGATEGLTQREKVPSNNEIVFGPLADFVGKRGNEHNLRSKEGRVGLDSEMQQMHAEIVERMKQAGVEVRTVSPGVLEVPEHPLLKDQSSLLGLSGDERREVFTALYQAAGLLKEGEVFLRSQPVVTTRASDPTLVKGWWLGEEFKYDEVDSASKQGQPTWGKRQPEVTDLPLINLGIVAKHPDEFVLVDGVVQLVDPTHIQLKEPFQPDLFSTGVAIINKFNAPVSAVGPPVPSST